MAGCIISYGFFTIQMIKLKREKYPRLASKIIVPWKLWKTYENDNKFFLLYLLVQSSASIMILTSSLEKDKRILIDETSIRCSLHRSFYSSL